MRQLHHQRPLWTTNFTKMVTIKIGSTIYLFPYATGFESNKQRIFADDTSLFVVVDDPLVSFEILNHDLKLIEKWANQWKMSFSPDITKPPI